MDRNEYNRLQPRNDTILQPRAKKFMMDSEAEISQALAQAGSDKQTVLDAITRKTAEIVGDGCIIALFTENQTWLIPAAYYHPDPKVRIEMARLLSDGPSHSNDELVVQMLKTGQPILISDMDQRQPQQLFQPKYWPYLEQIGIRSLLIVPLSIEGAIIGTLEVIRDASGRPYTSEDQAFLVNLADQAALEIANTHLIAAEQEARRIFENLQEAALTLTESLDLSVILEKLLDYLDRLVPYDSSTILLLEPDSHLMLYTARGYKQWLNSTNEPYRHIDFHEYQHLNTVITSQTSLLIPDTNRYPGWKGYLAGIDMGCVRNWLGVPLVAGGKMIGLYSVDKTVPGLFSQTHVQLAETLAAQAAIAIQNAQLFEQVQVSHEQLQALSRRLLEVQETERRQIARELHDGIGQLLTGLKLLLDVDGRLPVNKARSNLKKAQTLVDELMETVDELSFELRPAMLDDLGVLPALLWHFGRYMEQTGVNVSFKHSGIEGRRFDPEIETAVYRIVQEALTNVARHAKEKEVTVRLWAKQDMLKAQIEDRGIGFDPKIVLSNSVSIGLSGMRKRAALLGGNLEFHSVRGNGTSVIAELPLPNRPVQEATYDQDYSRR